LEWDERKHSGNPAASVSVKGYLKHVRVEQAKAHVMPKRAVPIFGSKVKRVGAHIRLKLRHTTDVIYVLT
jgi:hypothetical protein